MNTVTNTTVSFLTLNIKTRQTEISTFLISSYGDFKLCDTVDVLMSTVTYFVRWLLFLYFCLLWNCKNPNATTN